MFVYFVDPVEYLSFIGFILIVQYEDVTHVPPVVNDFLAIYPVFYVCFFYPLNINLC